MDFGPWRLWRRGLFLVEIASQFNPVWFSLRAISGHKIRKSYFGPSPSHHQCQQPGRPHYGLYRLHTYAGRLRNRYGIHADSRHCVAIPTGRVKIYCHAENNGHHHRGRHTNNRRNITYHLERNTEIPERIPAERPGTGIWYSDTH